ENVIFDVLFELRQIAHKRSSSLPSQVKGEPNSPKRPPPIRNSIRTPDFSLCSIRPPDISGKDQGKLRRFNWFSGWRRAGSFCTPPPGRAKTRPFPHGGAEWTAAESAGLLRRFDPFQ